GLNQRLIHPGGHAQLGDLPVPGGVPLVLAIAECQACALSQQGSPPGGGPLQLSDRSGFLFGCQPPAVTGWCRRSDGRCDDQAIGSEAAHAVRVELVFETSQDPPLRTAAPCPGRHRPRIRRGSESYTGLLGPAGSLEAAIDTGGRWRRPLLALVLGECRPGSIDPACSLHSDLVPTVGLSKELMTILVLSSSERVGYGAGRRGARVPERELPARPWAAWLRDLARGGAAGVSAGAVAGNPAGVGRGVVPVRRYRAPSRHRAPQQAGCPGGQPQPR